MRWLRWGLVACGAMAGGALTGGGRLAAAAPTLALHECRLEHPLRLASLPARCGRLAVAEDPALPGGAHIELRVAVVAALDRRSRGAPLFILAGGPGQAATDLYAANAGAFARINRGHDLVLVDQRGTGSSGRLDCVYPDDWEEAAPDPVRLRAATARCLAGFGDRVRFYTTSVAVRDLEAVRKALGYGRIDLYGSSYGTRVAQLYMRRHPDNTGAVILDGVTYPEQSIGPDTPADGERALDLILGRCERDAGCAAAFPNLRAELGELRRHFGPERRPLTLDDPLLGVPMTVEFNRGMLNAALRLLSYGGQPASMLPVLIHAAAAGDLRPLAAQTLMLSKQIADQLASGMQNSVICAEDEPQFAAAADRRRIAETYQGSDQLDALAAICTVWPRGPVDADLHAPLHSDVPTLLLSGEADPVTPPADAERAGRGLSRHRHLVIPGAGHGQLGMGCIPTLMAEFLDHPDPGRLDVGCLARLSPAPFFLTFTGPAP
jgi:pimeloyl-ACP methyl ester carboxylesterase